MNENTIKKVICKKKTIPFWRCSLIHLCACTLVGQIFVFHVSLANKNLFYFYFQRNSHKSGSKEIPHYTRTHSYGISCCRGQRRKSILCIKYEYSEELIVAIAMANKRKWPSLQPNLKANAFNYFLKREWEFLFSRKLKYYILSPTTWV